MPSRFLRNVFPPLAAVALIGLSPVLTSPVPIFIGSAPIHTSGGLAAQEAIPPPPTIAEKTVSLERQDGFIPFYYDDQNGDLYLEISLPAERFLYMSYLASGANVLLQRGAPSWRTAQALVHFERHDERLLLMRDNTTYVVEDREDAALERVLRESVPRSVVGVFPIVAEEGDRVLVDATDHFLQDAHGVPEAMAGWGAEGFRQDRDRSAIYGSGTRAFPRNTEVESLLTFATDRPGGWAASNLPDRRTLAVRQRHSLMALPAEGFRPRVHDVRTGLFFVRSQDMSAPVEEGYARLSVTRRRLEKSDPQAPLSEPIEPTTVYVEAGIPDEFREAVFDGIEYWNKTFGAAGYENAIRATDLPPDADPLDLRYPIVILWAPTQWVAMGPPVEDPRTGELIKGMVFLTGVRSRIDLNTYRAIRPALTDGQPDAVAFMMARMRWVVAHELGHALVGLRHNSVVPTMIGFSKPLLNVTDDSRIAIDLSEAFPDEPLPYDEWMVRYAYSSFESETDEAEELARIVEDGIGQGLRFVDDFNARSNPRATGRLHGDDVLGGLEREVAVRRVLLDHFSEEVLRPGEPMWLLFDRLIPVYFHHHYALAAVGKAIGGVDYRYALSGDGQVPVRAVDAQEQRRAIGLLLDALAPEELAVPEIAARLTPPRPSGLPSEFEMPSFGETGFRFLTGESAPIVIPLSAGGIFDPLDWARSLSRLVTREFFDPARAARVAALHASGLGELSLFEVMSSVVDGTWGVEVPSDPGLAALARVARRTVLDGLLGLAENEGAVAEVREAATWAISRLREDLLARSPAEPAERAHIDLALRDLSGFLDAAAGGRH